MGDDTLRGRSILLRFSIGEFHVFFDGALEKYTSFECARVSLAPEPSRSGSLLTTPD